MSAIKATNHDGAIAMSAAWQVWQNFSEKERRDFPARVQTMKTRLLSSLHKGIHNQAYLLGVRMGKKITIHDPAGAAAYALECLEKLAVDFVTAQK